MCGCDLPWVYDQELGTNNYSVRESFCLPILDDSGGLSALWNIMCSTALDFGHRANSRLASNRITVRKICLARI